MNEEGGFVAEDDCDPSSETEEEEVKKEEEEKPVEFNFVKVSWALFILVLLGFSFFVWAFLNFDREGLACQKQPFKWGAEKVVKRDVDGLYCSCSTSDGDSFVNNVGGYNPNGDDIDYAKEVLENQIKYEMPS